jgi:hypothetical protein
MPHYGRSAGARILEPGYAPLHDEDFWQDRSGGFLLFLSRVFYLNKRLPLQFPKLAVVAHHFHLKPLFPLLRDYKRFYVLARSENAVQLLYCTRRMASAVNLGGCLAISLRRAPMWNIGICLRHMPMFHNSAATVEKGLASLWLRFAITAACVAIGG